MDVDILELAAGRPHSLHHIDLRAETERPGTAAAATAATVCAIAELEFTLCGTAEATSSECRGTAASPVSTFLIDLISLLSATSIATTCKQEQL